jgi:hypothetical protein
VADHRGLVADRVDPGQQPGQQVGVADVAAHEVGVRGGRLAAVGLREQGVEQDDAVAVGAEPVGDVGADEPGSAGDQDAHLRDARSAGRPGI